MELEAGAVHCLSNATINFSWPKVVHGKQKFKEVIDSCHQMTKQQIIDELLKVMSYGDKEKRRKEKEKHQ